MATPFSAFEGQGKGH